MTRVAAVVPVGPGRAENLELCLDALEAQVVKPDVTWCVFDGAEAYYEAGAKSRTRARVLAVPRFEPGLKGEQPRNAGARAAGPVDALWFVDSDIVMHPMALACHLEMWRPGRVCYGPYDWLPPGQREPDPELFNDPRWEMMREDRWSDPEYDSYGQVNVGLGCFGGNLVWDRDLFLSCGGFWDEVHRGEDGELGLRAVSLGIPIRCAKGARGWHLHHDIDVERIGYENGRNIPMIDKRHEKLLRGEGFVPAPEEDSIERECPTCGERVPGNQYWKHEEIHRWLSAPAQS